MSALKVPSGTVAHVTEPRLSGRLNWLRAGVLGANDGIVSIAAMVVGVAAATPDNHGVIMAAGIAGLSAGALSMAAGEYVSVSSQRDAERAQLEREARWQQERPDWEFEQLVELNMGTGMSEATARAAAREQTDHDPVAIHALMHLGIDRDDLVSPLHASAASLVAFLVGGIGPLLAVLLAPTVVQVPITYAAVVAMLAVTGAISARLGYARPLRAIVRNIAGGSLAMAITYGIGHLVGVAL